MRLRAEATLGVGAILTLQLLLATLAIAVLTRMGPAIGHILEDNVYSAEAVEAMLGSLASPPERAEREADFDRWLSRAEANVTDEAERPLLARIRAHRHAALGGDPEAGATVVAALTELATVNRASMAEADARARRTGQAGAWAATLLGALTFALGILVYRRLRARIELPLIELVETTQRVRDGNEMARCAMTAAPAEIRQLAADLNWLIDRACTLGDRPTHPLASDPSTRDAELRRLLAILLDDAPAAIVVRAADGRTVAANQRALDVGLPPVSGDADEEPEGWTRRPLPGTRLVLLERRDAA